MLLTFFVDLCAGGRQVVYGVYRDRCMLGGPLLHGSRQDRRTRLRGFAAMVTFFLKVTATQCRESICFFHAQWMRLLPF